MAFSSRVTSRYAKSLLGLAVEKGILETVKSDIAAIVQLCDQNRDMQLFLHSPIIAHETKEKVLVKLFGGKLNDLTMAFISLLTKKGREAALYEVAKAFLNQYNEVKGIQKATVFTAVSLDAATKSSFETLIANSLNKKVELSEEVKEELLGGFVLRVEDRQIDASVKTKLQAIGKNIN